MTYLYRYCICLLLLSACGKPKDFYDEIGKGVYLTFVSSKPYLSGTDANASTQLVVSADGTTPASVNVYIAAAPTLDKTKWKKVKTIPWSNETILSVTNKEVADALGLTAGNLPVTSVYYFYNEVVTKNGQLFSSVNTSGADLENQAGFNTAMKWTTTITCPYDAGSLPGNYTVQQDDWQDWSPGDIVTLTTGPGNNQINLSKVWPNPAFGTVVSPLVAAVDPVTGALTVPAHLVFGNYGGTKIEAVSGTGFIFSCQGLLTINIHLNAPSLPADQGFNQLVLQK